MKTLDELEREYTAWERAPVQGAVRRLTVRRGDQRYDHPDAVQISVDGGVDGDRWRYGAANPDAAVSLMEARVADLIGGDAWAGVGDNLLVDFDLSEAHLPVGARLQVGEATLEVSPMPHLGCAKFQARFGPDALRWVNRKETRARRLRGLHTRVVEGGRVAVGDPIRVVAR